MADEDGEKKDNPFSFKKFVEKKHEVPQVSPYRKKKQQRAKNIFRNVKTPDIFEDEAPFPDVPVRTAKPGQGNDRKLKQSEETDDGGENPFSYKNFMTKDVASRQKRVLKIIDDEVHEIKPVPSVYDTESGGAGGQPAYYMYLDESDSQSSDVDSDGSADDSGHTKAAAQSGSYIVPPSDSSPSQLMLIEEVNRTEESYIDVHKLKEENEELKKKLLETFDEKNKEKKRTSALEKKLVFIERREKEETAALENMVHMVEKNLELTTQRALKAEAQVSRLKEEIRNQTKDEIELMEARSPQETNRLLVKGTPH